MTAMMIENGKRVAAGGARFQGHMIPIADIGQIARVYLVLPSLSLEIFALSLPQLRLSRKKCLSGEAKRLRAYY